MGTLLIAMAAMDLLTGMAGQQAGAQAGLSGWPCFAVASHDFQADYTAQVGSPVDFAAHGRCRSARTVGTIVQGALPPGLRLRGPNIVGIPQRPGDYFVRVKYPSGPAEKTGGEVASVHIRIGGALAAP